MKLTYPSRVSFHWFSTIILFLLLAYQTGTAQPLVEWDRGYGGDVWDECNNIENTSDGGFILSGYTSSNVSGDVSEPTRDNPADLVWPYYGGDFWLVKIENNGDLQWEKRYGGNKHERLWVTRETNDGGYLLGGWSNSDISGEKSDTCRGFMDYWVIKTDAMGNVQWDNTYGGDTVDYLYDMIPLSTGGYVLAGLSASNISGEKSEPNQGSFDAWIIRIDDNGNIVWDKTIGGDDEDWARRIQEAPDGNLLIGGGSKSDISGDVTTALIGTKDYWFIKIDQNNGNVIWERRYGGDGADDIQSFVQTQDGGYLLAGGSDSNASGDKIDANYGYTDWWVIKTNAAGVEEWQHSYGGALIDNCYSAKQNSIGYYILGGFSQSLPGPGKSSPNKGAEDFWVMYLDPNGNQQWEMTLGGDAGDVLQNLFQTPDGGYLFAGHSQTDQNGDKQDPSNGLDDFWVIKTVCAIDLEFNDTIVCPNDIIELNALDANCLDCNWRWNDGNQDSIRLISTTSDINYSVTLTDGVGCSKVASIDIAVLPEPALNLGADFELCENQVATLNTNTTGLTYNWTTGENTPTIDINNSGVFGVEVTDSNGCQSTDSITVNSSNLNLTVITDNTSCGEDNGAASILAEGGSGTYDITWNGNAVGDQINNLATGSYNVIVDDGNCQATATAIVGFSETPKIEWEYNFGGTEQDEAHQVIPNEDGTYLVIGTTNSNNIDISANNGAADFWILKLAADGSLLWEKNYGGSNTDEAFGATATLDGGYLIVGSSNSSNIDVPNNNGNSDAWVLKIDADGLIQWSRNFGGTADDRAYSVEQNIDGTYVIVGESASSNGDLTGNNGGTDAWILKLAIDGSPIWQVNYGGSNDDSAKAITLTSDGGYVVGAQSYSNNMDVVGNYGSGDFWLIKLSKDGIIEWNKNYGGSGLDEFYSLLQTNDKGYLLVGASESDDFDVTSNNGNKDVWVLKVNAIGGKEWENNLGGNIDDGAINVHESGDGGYVIGGYSESNNIDVNSGNNGSRDVWIMKLNSIGSLEWEQNYGGLSTEEAHYIQQVNDGGYIVAGYSSSNSIDLSSNNGNTDYWVYKLNAPALPQAILPADLVVCQGEEIPLDATDPNCTNCIYSWSDGISSEPVRTISTFTDATYAVTITDQFGCTDTDDLSISVIDSPVIELGADSVICENASLQLDAGNIGATYEWSNAENGQMITVSDVGMYTVTVTNANSCTASDTFNLLAINPLPIVDLGTDESFCEGGALILDATNTDSEYNWSNSFDTPAITVNTSGNYAVTVTNASGCTTIDAVDITVDPLPQVDLGADQAICDGQVLFLDAENAGSTFEWSSTTENIQNIEATTEGEYSVTVTDAEGCSSTDALMLTVNPLPVVDLGADEEICEGVEITLDAENVGATYEWSTSAESQTISVQSSDLYSVTVTDANNCEATSSINVNILASPNTDLQLTSDGVEPLCPGTASAINIENSELGISYQLYEELTPIGSQVIGTGTTISLPTDILNANANFTILATTTDLCAEQLDNTLSLTVGDNENPIVNCQADQTIFIDVNSADCNPEVSALAPVDVSDNCLLESLTYELTGATTTISPSTGINDASGQSFNLGITTVNYTATDAVGNVNTCSFNVEVIDNTPPLIVDNAMDITVECDGLGNTAEFNAWLSNNAGASATEDCSTVAWTTDPTLPILSDDCGETGLVTVTFIVTDEAGNSSTTIGTFTIEDTQAPDFTVPPAITINGDQDPTDLLITGDVLDESDACDNGVGTIRVASFTDVVTTSDCEDTIIRTWSLTDECGNTTEQDQNITIQYQTPIVSLSGATTICAGEEVDISFNLTGNGDSFDVVYTDGQDEFTLTEINDGHTITVSPVEQTNFSIISVIDNARPDCAATISGNVDITVFEIPTTTDAIFTCNSTNTFYTVSFEILNGDDSSYTVGGNTGNLTGSTFESDPIPLNGNYTFLVDDGNACGPTELTGSYDCECLTDAGTLDVDPQVVCSESTISIIHNGDAYLDGNDILQFVLHDGDANTIGTIIATNSVPEFDLTGLALGTYFITAIAGSDNGTGAPDFDDACYAVSTGTAIELAELPIATIEPLSSLYFTCSDQSLVLDGSASSPIGNISFDWTATDGGTIISGATTQNPEIGSAGTYTLTVTNALSGCSASASITILADDNLPDVVIAQAELITCTTETVELNATASDNGVGFTYEWSGGTILDGAMTLTPTVNQSANYTLTITDTANGCSNTASIFVDENTTPPIAEAGTASSFNCLEPEVSIDGSASSVGPNYAYQWTTTEGNILSGSTSLLANVDQAGSYTLVVTNLENGCSSTDEVIVGAEDNVPTSANIIATDPACFGDENGSIHIESVEGGTPPFLYSIDGENFYSQNEFGLLPSGNYPIIIQDAIGCEWSTTAILDHPNELQVELGDNIVIELGESAQLGLEINQLVDTFYWTQEPLLSCLDCFNPIVSPTEQTSYNVTVVGENGCIETDAVTVFVSKDRHVYIPSAFTPNGDGNNDFFMVYGDQMVEQVNTLKVFDRWGEHLFELNNFQPNSDPIGWDGLFRGRPLTPGVYVYFAEISFIDGLVETYKGSVTIIR